MIKVCIITIHNYGKWHYYIDIEIIQGQIQLYKKKYMLTQHQNPVNSNPQIPSKHPFGRLSVLQSSHSKSRKFYIEFYLVNLFENKKIRIIAATSTSRSDDFLSGNSLINKKLARIQGLQSILSTPSFDPIHSSISVAPNNHHRQHDRAKSSATRFFISLGQQAERQRVVKIQQLHESSPYILTTPGIFSTFFSKCRQQQPH